MRIRPMMSIQLGGVCDRGLILQAKPSKYTGYRPLQRNQSGSRLACGQEAVKLGGTARPESYSAPSSQSWTGALFVFFQEKG